MLKLLRGWLRAGVLEEGIITDTASGTPQGSPISPLLCNVALHVLDPEWARTSSNLGVLVRYADDLLVLCRSRARAEQARHRVAEILAGLGLVLHPDKTRIVCLTRGQQGSTSSAPRAQGWSRGGSEAATTCNDGRRTARWRRSEPRSGRQPTGALWATRSTGW